MTNPRAIGLWALLLAGAPLVASGSALAGEVTASGGGLSLGTVVNGVPGGSCGSGVCDVSGGTAAGSNLFHRFAAFDTRGAITGVNVNTDGLPNVFMAVTSPAGSFIDKLVNFSGPTNLVWLSPGGISLSGAGGFTNIQQLNLSTATGWRVGAGVFDAAGTTAGQAALLNGTPVQGLAGAVNDPAALAVLGLQKNGDLNLAGGLLTVDQGLLLDAQGGNVLLNAVQIFRNQSAAVVQGQSVQVTGNSQVELSSLTTPALTLNESTLNIGSDVTIPSLAWSGGTITGAGKLTTPLGGTATLFGSSDKTLQNKTWENSGTINLTDGRLYLYGFDPLNTTSPYTATVNGPALKNLAGGVINVSGRDEGNPIYGYSYGPSGSYYGVIGGALLSNAGTLNWGSTYGTQGYTSIYNSYSGFNFNNSGTVNINESLNLFAIGNSAGIVDSGSYVIANGKTLSVSGGSREFGAGASVRGSGTLSVESGSLTVSGSGALGGSTGIATTGQVALSGGSLNLQTVGGGPATITFNNPLTITGGVLNATDDVVANSLAWSGGTISGAGKLTTPTLGTATLSGLGDKTLQNKTWENSGTINLTDGRLYLYGFDPLNTTSPYTATVNGPALKNLAGGVINVSGRDEGNPIYGYSYGPSGSYYGVIGGALLSNAGTLNWGSTYGTQGYTSVYSGSGFNFNNSGTVNINESLNLFAIGNSAGIVDSGSYVIANGKTLSVSGGSREFGAGASVRGSGTLSVESGSLTVSGSGALGGSTGIATTGQVALSGGSLNLQTVGGGPATITFNNPLTITGGVLNATDDVVANSLAWSGGTISGAGKLTTPTLGTATLSGLGDKTLQNKTWENSGTINLTDGRLYLYGFDPLNTTSPYTATVNGPALKNLAGGVINVSGRDEGNPIYGYSYGSTGYGSVIGGALLSNAGTLNWGSTYGTQGYTSVYSGSGFNFNNSGTVNINESLNLVGAGNSAGIVDSGSYVIASGKTLFVSGGSREFGAGASVRGSGLLSVESGSLTVSGSGALGGSTGIATTGQVALRGGSLNLQPGVEGPATITFNNPLSISGGVLNASDDVVAPTLSWSGGTISGAGRLTTPSLGIATLSGLGDKTLQNKTWENSGTINLTDGRLYLYGFDPLNTTPPYTATVNGPALKNLAGGVINVSGRDEGNPIYGYSYGPSGSYYGVIGGALLSNAGTLNWGSTYGTQGYTSVYSGSGFNFNNSGTVNINESLNLVGAGNSAGIVDSGSYVIASGKTLFVSGGSREFGAGASVRGSGLLSVESGSLTVSGSGALGGSTGIATTGQVALRGGSLNLQPGVEGPATITFNNPLSISGGVLNASDDVVANSLAWSGGTISGAGRLTTPSLGIATLSGLGDKTLQNKTWENSGTINLTDGRLYLYGFDPLNTTPPYTATVNGPALKNLAGGVINVSGRDEGNPIYGYSYGPSGSYYGVIGGALLSNAGTLNWGSTYGTQGYTSVYSGSGFNFNNSGTVNINESLNLFGIGNSAGVVDSGSYVIASGKTLFVSGGSREFGAGASVRGSGLLSVESGSLTVSGSGALGGSTGIATTGQVALRGGSLNLQPGVEGPATITFNNPLSISGGVLNASDDVVAPTLSWSGGTISGAGRLTTPSLGIATLSGLGDKTLQNKTWENSGTINLTDGRLYLYGFDPLNTTPPYTATVNGPALKNLTGGVINVSGRDEGNPIYGYSYGSTGYGSVIGGALLSNAGTLNWGSTYGTQGYTSVYSGSGFNFNNSGTVNINESLNLVGAGNSAGIVDSGSYVIASGKTLFVSGGSREFGAGASVRGSGLLSVESGSLTVSGSGALGGSTGIATTGQVALRGGSLNLQPGVEGPATITFNNPLSISGGVLNASDDVVANSLAWSGGTISGAGRLTTPSLGIATLSGLGDKTLQNKTWENSGTINLTDGRLYLYGDNPNPTNPANAPVLVNYGAVSITSPNLQQVVGRTSGVIGVSTLNNQETGSIDWHYATTAPSIPSSGWLYQGTGALNLIQDVIVDPNAPISTTNTTWSGPSEISSLYLRSGTFTAAGDLTISKLYWDGGTITGAGKLITPLDGTATLFGSGDKTLQNKTWENSGTINLTDGRLYLYGFDPLNTTSPYTATVNGPALKNLAGGVINVSGRDEGNPIYGYSYGPSGSYYGVIGGALLSNAGTLNWGSTYGTQGYTSVYSGSGFNFNNSGTVNINESLNLVGAGNSAGIVDSGSYVIASGKTLFVSGGSREFGAGASVRGSGLLSVESGSLTVSGSGALGGSTGIATTGQVALRGGSLNLQPGVEGPATITFNNPLSISGGVLNASDDVVAPTLSWSGGTISGAGRLTTPSLGIATLSGLGDKTLQNKTWENSGTINLTDGRLYLYGFDPLNTTPPYTATVNGPALKNLAGGVINVSGRDEGNPIYGYSYGPSGSYYGVIGGALLSNAGTLNWGSTYGTQGYTSVYSGSGFNFNNSGTVNINESLNLFGIGNSAGVVDSGSYVIASGKTLFVSGGSREFGAGASVRGSGLLSVESGSLTVSGSGALGGSTGIATTGQVALRGGSLNLQPGVEGPATITFNNPLSISGGVLNASDDVVAPTLSWSGGTISGAGRLTTPSLGIATLSGLGDKTLQNKTWENSGTINLTDGRLYLYGFDPLNTTPPYTATVNGPALKNLAGGVINVSGRDEGNPIYGYSYGPSGSYYGVIGGALLSNAGTLNWGSTYGTQGYTSVYSGSGFNFNNSGTVNINESLNLFGIGNSAGVVDSGSYVIASGKTLFVSGGSREFGAGASVRGSGLLSVESGSLTVSGSGALGGSTGIATTGQVALRGGSLNLQPGVEGPATITFNNPLSISGGVLNASDDVVAPTLSWSGGTISGAGRLTTPSLGIATLSGLGDKTLQNKTWENSGTINLTDGRLYLYGFDPLNTTPPYTATVNGPALKNLAGGVINVSGRDEGNPIYGYSYGPSGSYYGVIGGALLSNAGTLNWGSTYGTQGYTSVYSGSGFNFNNSGTVNINESLNLVGAGNSAGIVDSGSYVIASGKTLFVSGGSREFGAGASVRGSGLLSVESGSLTVSGSGALGGSTGIATTGQVALRGGSLNLQPGVEGPATITFNNPLSISGGVLNASDDVLANSLAWSGGTISGAGRLTTPSLGIATLSGLGDKTLQNKTWENSGTINLTDGRLYLYGFDPLNTTPPYTATVNGPALKNLTGGVINVSGRDEGNPIYGYSYGSTGYGSVIGGALLSNAGTLNWGSTYGTQGYTSIYNSYSGFNFNNSGSVNVNENLRIYAGNSLDAVDTGSFAIAESKTLTTYYANRVWGPGSSLSGPGLIEVVASQIRFDPGSTFQSPSGLPADYPSLQLGIGGSVQLNGAARLSTYSQTDGALSGTGTLEVIQSFSRSGGTIGSDFSSVSITQASGDLAPGVLSVAGPLSLTTLDPGSTLLVNAQVQATAATSPITIQAAGSLVVGSGVSVAGTGAVNLQSSGDVSLAAGSVISSAATGDAVVLASGGNFNNLAGSAALNTPSGRWLVYSNNPELDNRGGLAYDFKSYGQSYTGSAHTGPGLGNGLLYAIAPTITPGLTGTISKTYDGNTTATLTGANYTTTGAIDGDLITLNNPAIGVYNSKNVAEAADVDVTGLSITSAIDPARNVPVYGYALGSSTATTTASITPLELTGASIASGSSIYGSALAPGAVSFSNIVGSDAVTSSAAVNTSSLSSSGKPVVGSYTQSASGLAGADAANYSFSGFTTGTSNYNINPRALTGAAIASGSSIYGSALAPGAVSFSNIVGSDAVTSSAAVSTSTLSSSGKPVVGSYTQSASGLAGADAANYSFSGFTTGTPNYSINPLTLTGAAIASGSSIYGSALAPGAVSFSNIVGSDAVTSSAAVNTSTLSSSGKPVVGSYTQSASGLAGADAANYSFSGFTSTPNYSINPLALTGAAIASGSSIYGSALAPGAVSFSNIVGNDAVGTSAAVNTSSLSSSGKPVVGSYTQSASGLAGADAANYSFSRFTSTPNYSINPLALTGAAIASGSSIYGSALAPGAVSFSNIVGSDAVTSSAAVNTSSLSSSGKPVVGSYTQSASGLAGADAANYSFSGFTTGTSNYNINPRALTGAAIASGSSIYGSALAPGAVSFSNIVGSDAVTSSAAVNTSTLSSSGKPVVGSYTQSASGLAGADAANYSFSGFTTGTPNYSINPLTLTGAAIASGSSIYGSALAPGAVSFSNIVGSDAVTSSAAVNTSTLSSSGKPVVGSYTQSASGLAGADAANYSFSGFTTGTSNYNINPRALTGAAIASGSSIYGSALAPGAVSFSNIVGSDAVTSSAAVNTSSLSSSGKPVVGSYTQSASGLAGADAANYSFSGFTTGTSNYNINPRALTGAAIASGSSIYGSALAPGAVSFSNIVGSDAVTSSAAVNTSTLSSSGKPVVGSYTQSASTTLTGADAANYSFSGFTTGTSNYNINPLALTVAGVVASNKVYDGNSQASFNTNAATFTGLLAGDGVGLTGSGLFADPNVGLAKSVAVSALALNGADAANYSLASAPTTLTADISIRPLSTWRGTVAGLWSDPANWDALPSGANVAAVAIPVGTGAVTYDADAGTTQLQSLTNNQNLNINGGSLTVSDATTVGAGATLSLNAGGFNTASLLNQGLVNGSGPLLLNGFYSETGSGRLGTGFSSATITQSSGDLSLRTLGATGPISLTSAAGGLNLSGASLTSPGGTITLASAAPLSLLNSRIDASGGAAGGTVQLDGSRISIIGSSVNTSGAADGGSIRIGGSPVGTGRSLPSNVTISGSSLVADPPGLGGTISIDGLAIAISGSSFNVFGLSGGSISLGSSSTGNLSLDPVSSLLGGGGASFGLVAGSIANNASVTGGVVTLNGQVPVVNTVPPLVTFQQSVDSLQPLQLATTVDYTAPISPLITQWVAPSRELLALNLTESSFLYSDTYVVPEPQKLSQPPAQQTTQQQTSQQQTTDQQTQTAKQQEDEQRKRLEDTLTKASNTTGSPAPLESPAEQQASQQTQRDAAAASAQQQNGGLVNPSVQQMSEQQTTAQFTAAEQKAAQTTAEKLGLPAVNASAVPSPAEIQAGLRQVIEALQRRSGQ